MGFTRHHHKGCEGATAPPETKGDIFHIDTAGPWGREEDSEADRRHQPLETRPSIHEEPRVTHQRVPQDTTIFLQGKKHTECSQSITQLWDIRRGGGCRRNRITSVGAPKLIHPHLFFIPNSDLMKAEIRDTIYLCRNTDIHHQVSFSIVQYHD